MSERRVVITGLGVVTAGGTGIEELFENICAKKQSVKRIDLFDPSGFPCQVAGQLDDFSASKFVPRNYRKAVKVMARDIEIAVAAADLAVRNAGITTRGIDEQNIDVESNRFGCNIGAGLICADLNELGSAINTSVTDGNFDFKKWGAEGINNLTPLWLLKYLPNMLACHVTIIHGAKGPSNTITCGEASGYLAAGEAARTIARGAADVAIAGGAESKVNPMNLLRQTLLGRVATGGNDQPGQACKPFDADADGTVIGEGGGLLILEDQARADERNSRVYAEFAGFGSACDPDGMNYLEAPKGDGLVRAISAAIADAGISPDQISLIIPHGTGVPAEDATEADAIVRALGERADTVAVSPLTGGFGNLFAGAGAVQIAVAAMALHKQTIPPAVNFEKPADNCRMNVRKEPAEAKLQYALCCAHATGGQNAAVILKRYEGD
ncbi:MAG: beta-ketoacyl-[acyl-carrier-protein] synthase family protein [Planctomycetota bacterium]|nr:beta-ketoacyl-[acyl-carrier-protein] synthase family protein [Planctomycetota bacterium]